MAETDDERKARERALIAKARKERLANANRRGSVTEEEMVADLQRVSKIHIGLGPSSSRSRYRNHGHYSERMVADVFGSHQEFRRAAGLIDSLTEGQLLRKQSSYHRMDKIRKYADKYLLPWKDRFKRNEPDDELRLLIGSDFHSNYADPFALECFIETAREVQPHGIVLAGDVVEMYSASSHPKRPGLHLSLQSEIDFTRREILRPLREACPDAFIDWHIGNHEDRLARMLASIGPQLACLDCLQFDKLFSLKDIEVNLVFGDSMLATTERDRTKAVNDVWKVYGGCYVVTHHTPGGMHPGKRQLERFGMSGSSGHVHRQNYYIEPSLAAPNKDWLVLGMMASELVGRTYVSRPSTWSRGFALATVMPSRGIAFQEPAIIKDGFCHIAGMRFDETDACREYRKKQAHKL